MEKLKDPLISLRARVHIARKQLGLNEEEYRALLQGVTGKESSKGMSQKEMEQVLMECARLGWRPTAPAAAPASTATATPPAGRWLRRPGNWDNPDKNPMYRKLYALICANGWNWGYVRGTAKKMFEAQKGDVVLEFLTGAELHSLVSALQIAANRRQYQP
ncbi:MAG: regulatory protein GemA [Magnetococcus sp. DMHC-8]